MLRGIPCFEAAQRVAQGAALLRLPLERRVGQLFTTEIDMSKMQLKVNVSAKFEWLEPPRSIEEQATREQADVMAGEAASKLKQVVQLLVLELLDSQVPNVEITGG